MWWGLNGFENLSNSGGGLGRRGDEISRRFWEADDLKGGGWGGNRKERETRSVIRDECFLVTILVTVAFFLNIIIHR